MRTRMVLVAVAMLVSLACGCVQEGKPYHALVIPEESRAAAAEFMLKVCVAADGRGGQHAEELFDKAWTATLQLYGVRTRGNDALASHSGDYVFVPLDRDVYGPEDLYREAERLLERVSALEAE